MTKTISRHAAAKMIRQGLKAAGIKASVSSDSYSGGSSVTVRLSDATPAIKAKANDIAQPHQYGHFDGMNDSYEYSNTNDAIPQVKFVFVENDISPALYQEAYDFVRNEYVGGDQLPALYTDARNISFHGSWVSEVVYRQIAQADSRFWAAKTAPCPKGWDCVEAGIAA